MRLILPKVYLDISDKPVLFLAGPMLGAYSWRPKALEQIADADLYVITPQATLPDQFLAKSIGEQRPNSYQLSWERDYLREISKRKDSQKGVIMFWLEGIDEERVDKKTLSRYARNTRRELGQLDGWLDYNRDINFVIGGEESFPEFETVKRCFWEHFPKLDFSNSLEETVKRSLDLSFS